MALACIEVLTGLANADQRAMLAAVHASLVDSLEVPDNDPTVRLVEYSTDHVLVPPRHSDRYTVVTVTMFAGRSLSTKRRLYDSVVKGLVGAGVPAADVLVVLHEPSMDNWGVNGGLPASSVDIGFDVEI